MFLEIFLQPSNKALDGIGLTVYTLSVSIAALQFGYCTMSLVLGVFPSAKLPRSPARLTRYSVVALAILTYAGAFPAYFLMSPQFRAQATAALLFSYPGTLTRYLLALSLNRRIKAFPLGTFSANILGTALLAIFRVLQNKSARPLSDNACTLAEGLIDGYCGCLTTISTFVAELYEMGGWQSYRYAFLSWTVSQLLFLVILGPAQWAGHVQKHRVCNFA